MSVGSKPCTMEDFVRESNRIERIDRKPTAAEIEAHEQFETLWQPTVKDMVAFVKAVQPRPSYAPDVLNRLRLEPHLNVSVGGYSAPRGGPDIRLRLETLLRMNRQVALPAQAAYEQHVAYERLHPFMDGNGRSGRILWLNTMGGLEAAPRGFLTHFYFQSLSEERIGQQHGGTGAVDL